MEVLKDYQYVDARGMGIRVKVIPVMRIFNHPESVFEATKDYLKTTLFSLNSNLSVKNEKTSEKMSGKIIALISQNSNITITEMSESIGVSNRTIERNLEKLQKIGVISRSGPAKGGALECKYFERI